MTWITRCPECATIYKVVPDQLNLASGWLRCGQCLHAFDSSGLVLPWVSKDAEPQGAVAEFAPRVVIDDLLTREDRSSSIEASDSMAELAAFSQALSSFKPLDGPLSQDVPVTQASTLDAEGVNEVHEDCLTPDVVTGEGARLRLVVWGLLLLLSLQGLWAQRHALATFVPSTSPLLHGLCRIAACEIQDWRAPEYLLIESSQFTQSEGGFHLQWTVHNTSAQDLGMTSLELKLHDAQGKVLVQRVLTPTDMGAPAVLSAGQRWSGVLHLEVPSELPVTGYRLLSFYP